jgi:asparagine synthase (glutamine-hydrolysing)
VCGITGFWCIGRDLPNSFKEVLDKMTYSLTHRGPDKQNTWFSHQHNIALGHRRLSIIDLSDLGSQPMTSSCGRYVIVFNGEIYNTKELEQHFDLTIPHDQGCSDTRIILEAISRHGLEKVISIMNGMFAFALWDEKDKQLFLGRDRLGVKPLYWSLQNNTLLFGSELKTFFSYPDWNPKINPNAIASIFHYNYVDNDLCIYENVFKVKPGSIITISNDQGKATHKITTYWSSSTLFQSLIKSENDQHQYFEQRKNHLHALLKDSVKLRMIADVPVGAFLSGGIDSSLVVSLMQEQSNKPIKTFCVGFEENEFDEGAFANKIAKHLNTDHYDIRLSEKDAFDLVQKMAFTFDEPFADSSQLPTYFVSGVAKQHVSVILSGDGGDELFAGYNRYIYAKKIWNIIHKIPQPLRQLMGGILSRTPISFAGLVSKISKIPQLKQKIDRLSSLLHTSNFVDFYQQILQTNSAYQTIIPYASYSIASDILDQLGDEKKTISGSTHIDIGMMQLIDINHYLCGDILTKVDRCTMAHGLEGRDPLLDYRLAQFAFSLPLSDKIRGNQGKYILRDILSSYMPKHLFERPKMGFGIPLSKWLRGRYFKPWAQDLIHGKEIDDLGLNRDAITQLWNEHISEKNNHQYALWGILMLLQWYRYWH